MGWRELGNGFSFVAAGQTAPADPSIGSLCAIDTNGALFVHSAGDAGGAWTPIAADKLKRVAVGRSELGGMEIWALRDDGRPIGSEWAASPNWRPVRGLLAEIAVGPAGVWGVTDSGTIFQFRRAEAQPFEGAWVGAQGLLTGIAVSDNALLGTGRSGEIFVGKPTSQKVDWRATPGSLRQVAACGKLSCGVNASGDVFYRVKSGKWFSLFDDQHLTFVMSCTDGLSLYALDKNGACWVWLRS